MPPVRKSSVKADVVLFYPKTGMDFGATIAPPHSLLAIAAPLHNRGYSVKIIDQRVDLSWREDLIEALNSNPCCVGISSMTGSQIFFAIEAAGIIRTHTDGKIPIVWGGPHATLLPEQTLASQYVDIVCIGEGELTFLELVEALLSKRPIAGIKGVAYREEGKAIVNPARELLDVEKIFSTPWELVDIEKYIHADFYLRGTQRSLDIGQTSRGCPFQCGFCSSATIRQRKWRAMSVEKASEIIIGTVKRFNLDSVWIRDDEFYIDRKRAYNICANMVKSELKIKWYTSGTRVDVFNRATDEELAMLKMSGADTLKFGAESGCNRILELMQKGIVVEDTLRANLKAKKNGIIPIFALMAGFPTETFAEINKTIDLMYQLKRENPAAQFETIASYTAFPGTPLYALALKMGLKPPQRLEDWSGWLMDDYDLTGRQLPWFNRRERIMLGNISYMSVIGNASLNAINAIRNKIVRQILKIIFIPLSAFERTMLKAKWYAIRPELKVIRFLRNKFLYKSHKVMR